MTTVSGLGRRLDAQARVGRQRRHLAGHEAVGQRQVDEAGPADLHLGADVVERGRRHDLLGHLGAAAGRPPWPGAGRRWPGSRRGPRPAAPGRRRAARCRRRPGAVARRTLEASGIPHSRMPGPARVGPGRRRSVRRRPHAPVEQARSGGRDRRSRARAARSRRGRRRRTRPRGRRCRTGPGPAPRRRRGRGPGSPARDRGTCRGASRRRCRSRCRWRRSWPGAACT